MRLFGVFFVAMVFLQPLAQAQRTTMTNGNGGTNFVGMDKLNDPTKEMLRRFIDASRLTFTGNGQLLAALGQDQEAAFMRERINLLDESMTRREIEETFDAQLRGVSALNNAFGVAAQGDTAQLNGGLAVLAQAVAQYDSMIADLPEARAAMNTMRMVSKSDTPAFYMVRGLPRNTVSLKQRLRMVVDACRKLGVKVPMALLAD